VALNTQRGCKWDSRRLPKKMRNVEEKDDDDGDERDDDDSNTQTRTNRSAWN
jgi:hypothetical protein